MSAKMQNSRLLPAGAECPDVLRPCGRGVMAEQAGWLAAFVQESATVMLLNPDPTLAESRREDIVYGFGVCMTLLRDYLRILSGELKWPEDLGQEVRHGAD